jgi:hypothetical protein
MVSFVDTLDFDRRMAAYLRLMRSIGFSNFSDLSSLTETALSSFKIDGAFAQARVSLAMGAIQYTRVMIGKVWELECLRK